MEVSFKRGVQSYNQDGTERAAASYLKFTGPVMSHSFVENKDALFEDVSKK